MRVFAAMAVVLALTGVTGAAQSFEAFGFKPPTDLVAPAFSDADIARFMETLDHLLAGGTKGTWSDTAADALRQFARRLQTGRLSGAQERTVLDHLDQIGRSRPGAAALVSGPRRMISELTVGKPAPDIAGTDLDGHAFKLSDFRDRVVVLEFSAEWCAICRTQAPYERFLLERYDKSPFALLGVQTGSSREAARQAHAADPLSHRSWWDEPGTPGTTGAGKDEASGPIAGAWNVVGWPASYVIDGDGVIRFVDLRDEDLLKAVRQLIDAQLDRDAKTKRVRSIYLADPHVSDTSVTLLVANVDRSFSVTGFPGAGAGFSSTRPVIVTSLFRCDRRSRSSPEISTRYFPAFSDLSLRSFLALSNR
jgi:peroxiredoxin